MNKLYTLTLIAAVGTFNAQAAEKLANQAALESARAKLAAMGINLTAEVSKFSGANPAAASKKPEQDDFGYATQATIRKTVVRDWTKDIGTGAGLSAALGTSATPVSKSETDFKEQTLVVVQDGDELSVQPKAKAKKNYEQTTVVSKKPLKALPASMVADTLFGSAAPSARTRTLAKTTTLGETTVIHSADLAALDPEILLDTPVKYENLSEEQARNITHIDHVYDEKLTKQAWQITFEDEYKE